MGPPKNTLVGNVGYGNVKAEDPDNIATNVLVIMAARPTKSWRMPIAYFLIQEKPVWFKLNSYWKLSNSFILKELLLSR